MIERIRDGEESGTHASTLSLNECRRGCSVVAGAKERKTFSICARGWSSPIHSRRSRVCV